MTTAAKMDGRSLRARRKHAKLIAHRIVLKRLDAELSQKALATPVGLTGAYVSRLEIGDRYPSWEALAALAGPLDTTALWLLTGDERACCPMCGREAG